MTAGMREVLELPADPRAARLARAFLRERAAQVLPAGVLEDALLLVSEVATNAVVHGTPPLTVGVAASADPPGIRVWVTDGNSALPEVLATTLADASGRGMSVVDALATRWGVEPLPEGGKRIWFDVCGAA